MTPRSLGPDTTSDHWINTQTHKEYLLKDAAKQFDFFRASRQDQEGFHTLALDGSLLASPVQELHTTTRMTHSFALGKIAGAPECDPIIDQGMRYLQSHHNDAEYGGFLWGLDDTGIQDDRKLAYGHVFTLLAASSALAAGHPEAQKLLNNVDAVLDKHFWEEGPGLFADEWNRDWTPFSTYRGMNANMHGTEALLAAYEATGREKFLNRAASILDFFLQRTAPDHNFRIPEHYNNAWQPDLSYSGNPMFRPAGTTPGHSFEWARLSIQLWDLKGRPDDATLKVARKLTYRALEDAWDPENGGFYYTLKFDGTPDIKDTYWWPVTEAIGILATLIKCDATQTDETWYRKLWTFADDRLIDHVNGGWYPEIDQNGKPDERQFIGKPDIYHSIQATLLPLSPGLSDAYKGLNGIWGTTTET